MRLMRVCSIAMLVGVLWSISCSKPRREKQNQEMAPGPKVTESRALQLANAEFAKNGGKVSDYDVIVKTDSTEWIVQFTRKGPYVPAGGQSWVTVEKATGKVVFMPGE